MATAVASNEVSQHADEVGARLYAEHAEMLLRYCRGRLGSEVEAEDAVQTTFVYALQALRRGVSPDCEAAWLTTIAKNICLWQRRTQARRGPLATDVDLDTVVGPGSQPGDHDELIRLDDALASMPEQQRRALVLREWRGAAPVEIAQKLDLTPTATHALLTRARSSLALALTVARQPALALVWLACELKSLVKALVGSVSAKAGVAAVTIVATTGVTAALVDQTEPERRAAAAPPALVEPTSAVQVAVTPATRRPAPARPTRTVPSPPVSGETVRPPVPAGRSTRGSDQPAPAGTTTRATRAPTVTPPAPKASPAGPSRSVARPTPTTPPPAAAVPELPVTPKLPVAPKLPVPPLPEVVPPKLPEVPGVPVPPVVEVPQVPPVPETVAEVADVVRQTGLLP